MRENYVFFWGGPFSQWAPSTFIIDGVAYNCCEQYMMAKKALMFGDYDALKEIMESIDPREQRAIGRRVKNFNAEKWNKYCRQIVYDANHAKFTQNEELFDILMETVGKEIVEASPEDKIWGVGLHESDDRILNKENWLGTNWLGEAIMQVRNNIILMLNP